jgi:septal ring factor EnvC (AmiA/AmiB activator)
MTNANRLPITVGSERAKEIEALYSDKSALEKYTCHVYAERAAIQIALGKAEGEVARLKELLAEQDLALEELDQYYVAHATNWNPFARKPTEIEKLTTKEWTVNSK